MAKMKEQTTIITPAYVVLQPFQDAREYATHGTPSQYQVGDDVSHFDVERLARVVELGLVQKPEEAQEA